MAIPKHVVKAYAADWYHEVDTNEVRVDTMDLLLLLCDKGLITTSEAQSLIPFRYDIVEEDAQA